MNHLSRIRPIASILVLTAVLLVSVAAVASQPPRTSAYSHVGQFTEYRPTHPLADHPVNALLYIDAGVSGATVLKSPQPLGSAELAGSLPAHRESLNGTHSQSQYGSYVINTRFKPLSAEQQVSSGSLAAWSLQTESVSSHNSAAAKDTNHLNTERTEATILNADSL